MKTNFNLIGLLSLALATSFNAKGQATSTGNAATPFGAAPNANEYVGFSTGFNLTFKTNGTEKMRILNSTGDVGIGSTAPGARLDVFKASAVQLRLTHSTLAYTDFQTTSVGALLINPKTPSGPPKIGFNVLIPAANFHSNLGFVKFTDPASTTRGILFNPSVLGGGGGDLPSGSSITSVGTVANEGLSLMTSGGITDAKLGAFAYDNSTGNWKSVWETKNESGNPNLLLVKNGGNVGIGTTNAIVPLTVNGKVLIGNPSVGILSTGYKLYVQEGILTEKVKVQLVDEWADYVFAKDYKLKSLNEVADYIAENKHLPGIASAEELKEQGGFDVAKMDAKLLEKIEELTLYVIEQNKKIETLQNEMKELKKN